MTKTITCKTITCKTSAQRKTLFECMKMRFKKHSEVRGFFFLRILSFFLGCRVETAAFMALLKIVSWKYRQSNLFHLSCEWRLPAIANIIFILAHQLFDENLKQKRIFTLLFCALSFHLFHTGLYDIIVQFIIRLVVRYWLRLFCIIAWRVSMDWNAWFSWELFSGRVFWPTSTYWKFRKVGITLNCRPSVRFYVCLPIPRYYSTAASPENL